MSAEKKQKVLAAFDNGEITEEEARGLLTSLNEMDEPKVLDERHDAISWKDRALVKNLGVDEASSINYLQEQYPQMEFKKDRKGEIITRNRDEKDWKKLDPSGFDIEDITDVMYDIPSGIAEGAATALGGLVGGIGGTAVAPGAGTVGGALAGGAAAGAAAGAGSEAVRQSLGKYFGVADEYDTGQIGTAAAFGAASPLLFGTGAAGKQVAKAAAKRGLSEAAEKQLLGAQSGVVRRGFDASKNAVFPRIGQLMSGVDKDTIRWASKNMDKIKDAEDAYGQVAIYSELSDAIQNNHLVKKEAAGEAYGQALDNLQVMVDVESIEQPLRKLQEKYQAKALEMIDQYGDGAVNKADFQNAMYIDKKIEEYTRGSGVLEGRQAKDYMDLINDLTGIRKNQNIGKLETVDRELQNAARQVARNVDEAMKNQVGGDVFKQAKTDYAKALSREKDIAKYFKDEETTESTLNNLLSPKRNARRKKVMELAEDVGVPIDEAARESIATSIFARPSMDIQSLGGTTSTSRSVPLGGLGGLVGYSMGSGIGQGHGGGVAGAGIGMYLGSKIGSPAALRNYMRINQGVNRMGGAVQNMGPVYAPAVPQTSLQIWQNLQQNER